MAPKQILNDFPAILESPNRLDLSWNLLKNEAPSWVDNFSLLEASGSGLGLDFGLPASTMLHCDYLYSDAVQAMRVPGHPRFVQW